MIELKEISAPEQKNFDGLVFPLAFGPGENQGDKTPDDVIEWIHSNRSLLADLLLKHGAILFRGLPTKTADSFNSAVDAFGYENFPYVGGAAPRKHVVGNVFTSNESPPASPIPFHHEMAQVPNYPARLFFYCDHPSTSGGETPILISNLVYQRVLAKHPQFVADLQEKGVRYIRVLPEEDDNESAIGRGWKSTFNVQTREEAEERCKSLGTTWEWLDNGCMKTISASLPAIKTYPKKDNQMVWFNSIVAAYTGWEDVRNKAENSVTFADGTPLPKQAVLDTAEIMEEIAVNLGWQHGDFIIIDNNQVMHARRSFVPPRRVYASLAKETLRA